MNLNDNEIIRLLAIITGLLVGASVYSAIEVIKAKTDHDLRSALKAFAGTTSLAVLFVMATAPLIAKSILPLIP